MAKSPYENCRDAAQKDAIDVERVTSSIIHTVMAGTSPAAAIETLRYWRPEYFHSTRHDPAPTPASLTVPPGGRPSREACKKAADDVRRALLKTAARAGVKSAIA